MFGLVYRYGLTPFSNKEYNYIHNTHTFFVMKVLIKIKLHKIMGNMETYVVNKLDFKLSLYVDDTFLLVPEREIYVIIDTSNLAVS